MADHELDWDSTLENDGQEFSLLPEGNYDFQVLSMERQRYNGGPKLPPCPMAVLKVQIFSPDGKTSMVNHRLYLYSTMQGLLSAFFRSIGEKKRGESVAMNWNHVPGATGRCRVGVRTGADGNQYNEIKRFLDPNDSKKSHAAPASGGWNAGAFGAES